MGRFVWTPEAEETAREMHWQGASWGDIGREIGCYPDTVQKRIGNVPHRPKRRGPKAAPDTTWTPERVAELTRLWSEGSSAGQIAVIMSLPSRNAVIGKVHRLKLPARKKAAPSKTKPKPSAMPPVRLPKPPVFEPMAPETIPDSAIKFDEISDLRCRFPLGGRKDRVTHFCGAPVKAGKSYCSEHAAICYRPVDLKRQRASDRYSVRAADLCAAKKSAGAW